MESLLQIKENLLRSYPYKIELHAHTKPASTCGEVPTDEVLRLYKEKGYSGIALTNHVMTGYLERHGGKENYLRFITEEIKKARQTGEKLGIRVYWGAELRFESENDNDYLLLGVDEQVLSSALDALGGTLQNFVKNVKDERSILIHAHPFRNDMVRMDPELLDGIESFNLHPNHNSRVGLSAKLAAEQQKPAFCGTDYHHLGHEGLCAMRLRELPEDSFQLARVLKTGDCFMQVSNTVMLP